MVIFLIALALLCLVGIKFSFKEGFSDYMSPGKTGSIKGIFVIIVLLSHVRQYVTLDSSPMNAPFKDFMIFLGQLMVVMFMFYSGYGVFLGLKNKPGYVKTLPAKRILKVLLHYDIAVLIFYLVGLCLGENYSFKKLLLSLIGLDAVGNSVWFIFTIIILYALTFIAFIFAGKHTTRATVAMTVLSIAAVLALRVLKGKEYWWYDTLMCYPLGMWFAILKPYIDKIALPNFNRWFACTASIALGFAFLMYLLPFYGRRRLIFMPAALAFALLIAFVSMRVSVDNSALQWFGKRVFGIYILQRIPMNILSHFGANENPFLFAAACFAITIVLAEIFERCMDKLDGALHLGKKPTKPKPIKQN